MEITPQYSLRRLVPVQDTLAPVSSESDSNESELSNPLPRNHSKAYIKNSNVLDFLHSFVENQEKRYEKEHEEKKRKNKCIMNAWTSCDNFWRKCQMALIKILQSKP